MARIRAKVVCILRDAARILLIRITDSRDGRSYLLPPGGGVELGELLDDAMRRELFEETGTIVERPRRIGMIENVFTSAGGLEHELVFVYEAECDDPRLRAAEEHLLTESSGERFVARWYTAAEIAATGLPVYPEGLFELSG